MCKVRDTARQVGGGICHRTVCGARAPGRRPRISYEKPSLLVNIEVTFI